MQGVVRRMGNSSGVIIPKPLLAAIGAQPGDAVEITARDGALLVVPIRAARAGWADEAKAIAQAGDEPSWPDFGNEADPELTW